MDIPEVLVQSVFQRGSILHYDGFNNIDHGKFFVILGVCQQTIVGFSFINSNINANVIRSQEQLDLQFPMLRSDYEFLKHTSFLCASDIEQYPLSELLQSYENNKIKVVGKMLPQHMSMIIEACKNSRIISKIDKIRFLSD